MEGYEIYRLSDEEIQHFGVKGMKWGKRKSRSAYMQKVDAHETKTKSVAAAKSASGSAKRKAYMDAVRANDNKGKAIRDTKAKEKTDKKSATSYMDKVRAHENKTKAVAAAKSESGKAKRKAYMDAVNAHEKKGQDIASAKSKEKSDKRAINTESSAKREVKGAARKQLAKARAEDLSEKLSKGLNIAVAVNDVYGDISPTGLKNHFANAEQLEKYGIKYNP